MGERLRPLWSYLKEGRNRLIFITAVSLLLCNFAALMILPTSPDRGNFSYWWASEESVKYLGQGNKALWYTRAGVTAAYAVFVALVAGTWYALLARRQVRRWIPPLLSFVLFLVVGFGLQLLRPGGLLHMGSRTAFDYVERRDGGVGYLAASLRIPDLTDFAEHPNDYLDCRPGETHNNRPCLPPSSWARWLYAPKPVGHYLLYRWLDVLGRGLSTLLGYHNISLEVRGVLVFVLIAIVGALTIFPAYALSSQLYSEKVAYLFAMLFPFMPVTVVVIAWEHAHYYLLQMLIVTLSLWLFASAQRRRMCGRVICLSFAGAAIAGGALLHLSAVTYPLLLGMYGFLAWQAHRDQSGLSKSILAPLLDTVLVVAIAVGLLKVLQIVSPYDPFADLARVHWMGVSAGGRRSWTPFDLLKNLAGPLSVWSYPLVLFFLCALWSLCRDLVRGWSTFWTKENAATVAFVLYAFALAMSMPNGETARQWSFLAPLFTMIASHELAASADGREEVIRYGLVVLALQALQALVFKSVMLSPE